MLFESKSLALVKKVRKKKLPIFLILIISNSFILNKHKYLQINTVHTFLHVHELVS